MSKTRKGAQGFKYSYSFRQVACSISPQAYFASNILDVCQVFDIAFDQQTKNRPGYIYIFTEDCLVDIER